jgi:hypothetical protein
MGVSVPVTANEDFLSEPPEEWTEAERWYNPADEITIVILLERPGTIGASFRDYAYLPGKDGPSTGIRHLWPCAAVRTANGVTTAVLGGARSANGTVLSFPSTFKGKPLNRFIANQRVFGATFYVNPAAAHSDDV